MVPRHLERRLVVQRQVVRLENTRDTRRRASANPERKRVDANLEILSVATSEEADSTARITEARRLEFAFRIGARPELLGKDHVVPKRLAKPHSHPAQSLKQRPQIRLQPFRILENHIHEVLFRDHFDHGRRQRPRRSRPRLVLDHGHFPKDFARVEDPEVRRLHTFRQRDLHVSRNDPVSLPSRLALAK